MPKRKSVGSGNTSVASPAKQEKATTPAKKQRKVESPVTKSPARNQQSPKGKANEVEKKGKKNNKKADADSDDEAENLLTKSVKTSVTGQQAKKSLWEEEEQSDEGDELLQLLEKEKAKKGKKSVEAEEEDEQDEEEEEDDEDGEQEQENGEFEVVEGADINSDDSDGAEDDEFLGGSDDEEELEVEKKSKKIVQRQKEDEALSALEFQHSVQDDDEASDMPILPPKDEGEDDTNDMPMQSLMGMDLEAVRTHMHEVLRVLNNFGKLREPGRQRREYLTQLRHDIAAYYGYSEWMVAKILNLFTLNEAMEFFEANEAPRPLTIRTNTLKTRRRELAQSLIQRGVNLDPLSKWSNVGLQIYDSPVPIGATPEYLTGQYMLQSASSFIPVLALDPQPGERVLDMCAAPGGKTTYIAQMMKNTGVLFSNDKHSERVRAVVANVHRMGIRNTVITNYDGRMFPRVMGGFDRILLDAPCTGSGVISKDPSVKTQKDERDVHRMSHIQKELILAAIDSVDMKGHSSGGAVIVYSTCSILIEENEAVVDYALKKRAVKVVPSGVPFGKPGFTRIGSRQFHPSLKHAVRVYPHTHNMDGFFVCKLIKYDNMPVPIPANVSAKPEEEQQEEAEEEHKEEEAVVDGMDVAEVVGEQPAEEQPEAETDAPKSPKKKTKRSKKGANKKKAGGK